MLNHRIVKLVVAFAIGIFLSWYSYQMITDPEPARERALEDAAVYAAREIVRDYIATGSGLEMIDPLAPDRVVGKSYIYPVAAGWQVSGYYRRGSGDRWHPFLMSMDSNLALQSLSIKDADPALSELAGSDARLEVTL
jgi:hypothetical protein